MTNLLFILTVAGVALAVIGVVASLPVVYLVGSVMAITGLYRSFTGSHP